jgi:hypothetical protein
MSNSYKYIDPDFTYTDPKTELLRALQTYPNIEFLNDLDGEQFKVTIHRPALN